MVKDTSLEIPFYLYDVRKSKKGGNCFSCTKTVIVCQTRYFNNAKREILSETTLFKINYYSWQKE